VVAEIIEFKDIVRARARRRERALTERCLAIMEECLASSIVAYHEAAARERPAHATKIRQLEDLITYASTLP
jgi:hypothetical protein